MADFKTFADFDSQKLNVFLSRMEGKYRKFVVGSPDYAHFISPIIFRDIDDHFRKEQGPDGKWKARSKKYSDLMNKQGKSKILQVTGALRQNFKPENFRATKGNIVWFNNAKTKSNFPYAAAHDIGGPKLPKRSFMWLSPSAMKNIAKRTLIWIKEIGYE